MKKLMVIITVFLSAGTLSAQEFVEFGAKAGVNFASLNGDNDEGLGGVTSFHLGLVAEFPLTERFSIQPEVLYSGLGSSAYDGEVTWKSDYISVPVMLKYYVVNGLSLEAGPQVSFNVVAEGERDGETFDLEDMNSTDFGAGVGVGYELPMGLFFQGRYGFGFNEVFEGSGLKNNVLQLSAGYKF